MSEWIDIRAELADRLGVGLDPEDVSDSTRAVDLGLLAQVRPGVDHAADREAVAVDHVL